MRGRLVLRLMNDKRVSPWLKLLPFTTLLYFLFPDLLIGPFDDAAIIFLGLYLFVELCPAEVVKEHLDDLRSVIPGEWREAPPAPPQEAIEGTFTEAQETPKIPEGTQTDND